jgi:hypothetical protein
MPVVNIQSLTKPTTLTVETDTGNPYSFQEWKLNHNNIDARAQIEQYNVYLKDWYKKRAAKPQAINLYVKTLYINFLKQLGLTARNEEEQQFFSSVNFDDNLDLQTAITFYARKLKDVSRYLAERRNSVVYTKLKNNLLGTSSYLERLFYNYILSVYTQRPDSNRTGLIITNGDLVQYLPNLEDITDTFTIEIEELYDTANYLDRDPSVNISQYTTFAAETSAKLYETSYYEIPAEYLLGLIIDALNAANTLNPCYGVTGFAGTNVSNSSMASSNVYVYTGDGATTTYNIGTITKSDVSLYRVSIDGLSQTPGTAYTISVQNSSIIFSEPVPAGAEISIIVPA